MNKHLIIVLLIIIAFISLKAYTAPSLKSKFGIEIPKNSVVLATNHDIWTTDWSVAWLIEIHSETKNIVSDFVPHDFTELLFSTEPAMKNHYYRTEVFNKMFDSESFRDTNMTIYIGGPSDGASFVAISKNKKTIIYHRFKI